MRMNTNICEEKNEIFTDLIIYKYKFTDAYKFIGKNKNIQNSAYKYLYNKIMVHIMNMNYDDASNFKNSAENNAFIFYFIYNPMHHFLCIKCS